MPRIKAKNKQKPLLILVFRLSPYPRHSVIIRVNPRQISASLAAVCADSL